MGWKTSTRAHSGLSHEVGVVFGPYIPCSPWPNSPLSSLPQSTSSPYPLGLVLTSGGAIWFSRNLPEGWQGDLSLIPRTMWRRTRTNTHRPSSSDLLSIVENFHGVGVRRMESLSAVKLDGSWEFR